MNEVLHSNTTLYNSSSTATRFCSMNRHQALR